MKLLKRIILFITVVSVFMSSFTTYAAKADPVLTSREDFLWGACMHTPSINATIYGEKNTEEQIHLAAKMGAKIIRTGIASNVTHTDKVVRLANAYGMKVMAVISIPGKTFDADAEVDLQRIKDTYQTWATRYDGKHGFGKIDYIQIDNEMYKELMGRFGVATEGSSISNYNLSDLAVLTPQVKAATEGIKASGSDVKSVINFAFRHYGMLDYFYQNGVEWDVVGHDWYSDGIQYDISRGKTPYQIGDELYEKFGKEVILCEHNVLGTGFDFDDNDVSNWDILVDTMEDYYKREYVIGAIFYEICEREAHFGLCFTKTNGEIIGPKPIYTRIQKIIGGNDNLAKLDWAKVEASYGVPKTEDSEDGLTSSGVSQSGGGVREEITVIENTPDPIIKKNTTTEVTVKKIPVWSGKIFTLPIIISAVLLILALGYTTFTIVYLIKKKKSNKQYILK